MVKATELQHAGAGASIGIETGPMTVGLVELHA
jgi:hypothetical protein